MGRTPPARGRVPAGLRHHAAADHPGDHLTRAAAALVGLLAIAAPACGGATSSHGSSSPCAAASPGLRLTSVHGQGSATTASFTVCGGWSADLDWRCQEISEVTTAIVGEGRRQDGPFGDGLVGMNIVSISAGGTYRFQVQAPQGCSWNIDVDAGRI